MEQENSLIDMYETNFKYAHSFGVYFWKNYLKKSWLAYLIIIVFFTIAFAVWYFIDQRRILLYYTIFCPIVLTLVFFVFGVYKKLQTQKRYNKITKNTTYQVKIYTTHIELSHEKNGTISLNQYPYSKMFQISLNRRARQIKFVLNDKSFICIDKDNLKTETFEFLSALTYQVN